MSFLLKLINGLVEWLLPLSYGLKVKHSVGGGAKPGRLEANVARDFK